jgi:hypothetical protein
MPVSSSTTSVRATSGPLPDGANERSAKHQGAHSSLPPPVTPVLFSLAFYCRRICVFILSQLGGGRNVSRCAPGARLPYGLSGPTALYHPADQAALGDVTAVTGFFACAS